MGAGRSGLGKVAKAQGKMVEELVYGNGAHLDIWEPNWRRTMRTKYCSMWLSAFRWPPFFDASLWFGTAPAVAFCSNIHIYEQPWGSSTKTPLNKAEDNEQHQEGSITFLRCQPIVVKNPMNVRKVQTRHNLLRYEYLTKSRSPERRLGSGPAKATCFPILHSCCPSLSRAIQ